jgi:twitching motility protein PilT
MSRDALRAFKAAAWGSEAELAAFAAGAEGIGPSELLKWLGVLLEPASAYDPAAHARRVRAFAGVADKTVDPSLFVPYVRALRTADPDLRTLLCELIPRSNSVPGHIELCRMLGAPEPELRKVAANVLAPIAGKAAFDALVELAADASFGGRIEALDLMMPRAQHQGGALVATVVATGKPHERVHALRILVETPFFVQNPSAALEIGRRALDDPDERVASRAIAAVATFASEADFHRLVERFLWSDDFGRARAAVEAMRRFATPRTNAVLTRKMREGPNTVRLAVIETAEAIGSEHALPVLVDALTCDQMVVRTHALEAIGRLSDAGRIDPARAILWLLRSRDVNVRRIAIEVLNRVGDPTGELGPRLLRWLRDEDWWVRERTMDALIDIAGPRLTRHLLPFLKDPSPVVRRFATVALKRIREGAPVSALLTVATEDEDWWVREEAIAAVAHVADARAAPHLLALATQRADLRRACIEALVTMKSAAHLPHILEWLGDDDPDVRAAAVEALGALGSADDAGRIQKALEDPVARVRRVARGVMARWTLEPEQTTMRGQVALDGLLSAVVEDDADDLLLFAGRVPYVKRRGQVDVLYGWKPLTDAGLRKMLEPHLAPAHRAAFASGADVDFSYEMPGLGVRLRVNLFQQSTGAAAVFRIVKNDALLIVLDNLGLPPGVASLADLKDGLVIIGGPTGSGKSTTLAALVDRINRSSARHIVTIEDPIETVHLAERSLVTQREVGSHTSSFQTALRAALREDPDVIVVGEMRDPATFQFAVSAAETGHLVLGTMHTTSAETSVSRIIHAFAPQQQPQVRAMLAASLRAVVCQNLLRRKTGGGRVVAAELMVVNDAIANLIRKNKEFQIPVAITTSGGQGMVLMDNELARLVREGHVEPEEAYARAIDKGAFEAQVAGRDARADTGAPKSSRVPAAPASSAPRVATVQRPATSAPAPPPPSSSGRALPPPPPSARPPGPRPGRP